MLDDVNHTNDEGHESILRARLQALDEPVERLDWSAVLARSHPRPAGGRLRYGLSAAVATGALVLLALSGNLFTNGEAGQPSAQPLAASAAFVPFPSVLSADGAPASLESTLVLYSRPPQQAFLGNAEVRERSLQNEQKLLQAFNRNVRATYESTSIPVTDNEESLAFDLYSDPSFNRRYGSAYVACLYAVRRDTLCNASIDLTNGTSLTATGMLQADSLQFDFALTGSTGRYLSDRAALRILPIANSNFKLSFNFT